MTINVVEELKAALLPHNGWNQKTLAKKLGVSAQYLSDVLRERRNPGPKILKALNIEKVITYRYVCKNSTKNSTNAHRENE